MLNLGKKPIKKILSVMLALTLCMVSTMTISAAYKTIEVRSYSKMTVGLNAGKSGYSNEISFRVSGAPADATIDTLEIYTGDLKASGAVLSDYLIVENSAGLKQEIRWTGGKGTYVTASLFEGAKANDTYYVSFHARCAAGPIIAGRPSNYGYKTYSNLKLRMTYEYKYR